MAEPPIGKQISTGLLVYQSKLMCHSPRWWDWVPQSGICSASKHSPLLQGIPTMEEYLLIKQQLERRIFRTTNFLPSLVGPSSDQKSALATLLLRISCAGMKLRRPGRCCRSHILYAGTMRKLPSFGELTGQTDGEWHCEEVGRHAAFVGFHLQREVKSRYLRQKNSPHGTPNESFKE